MEAQATIAAVGKRVRAPKILICSDYLPRIEALGDGAMSRDPALAQKLLDEVARARIVSTAKMPATTVSIGSVVTYREDDTGQQNTIMLVFPADADIDQHKVSLMTPIGVALLGLSEGASFHWETRDKKRRTLTVTRVTQEQEAIKES